MQTFFFSLGAEGLRERRRKKLFSSKIVIVRINWKTELIWVINEKFHTKYFF